MLAINRHPSLKTLSQRVSKASYHFSAVRSHSTSISEKKHTKSHVDSATISSTVCLGMALGSIWSVLRAQIVVENILISVSPLVIFIPVVFVKFLPATLEESN